jgi:Flp pilus assembly protein protease CpaA
VTLAIACVLAACAAAVVTDLRFRVIPNAVTIPLGLAGVGISAMHGFVAGATSLGLIVATLVLGTAFFSMGWLGGGDVKLLAAGAGTLGFPDALPFLLYTALGGGVLAIGVAAATGSLGRVITSAVTLVRPLIYSGTVAPSRTTSIALPYGVAIAFGATAVALSHTVAPFLTLRIPL